ncbi:8988_t:CDS:2 [Funneliformis geosporum]|uniref:6081_t:CDS:1 n=1 Tax=Funneliformis geosporum TaxID=1117311 RepID=A0A9W4SW25_9GLOM|nr:6081_t:CDS:2 [Funneliformis geosporum]CAI2183524.1 8988_t:CDS:2 [Funneliformis geosporum]
MTTTSPTNSSGTNRPTYIKTHKNATFSYAQDCVSFQQGTLGDSDSQLVGILHLKYQKTHQVKNVLLHLKGVEKTSWHKAQARSKALYTGEQILVDQTYKIWEQEEQEGSINCLDIPFQVKLPYNLPETITTEVGSVNYTLRAIINRKGGLVSSPTQVIEVNCPLRRTINLDGSNNTPYKLRGESRSGLDYTFVLPPNKSFNLGTYVSIPMRIRFLRPGISVERVEISLKTCMDFRCNNPNETRHTKEQAASLLIPRQEIRYIQPLSHHYEASLINFASNFVYGELIWISKLKKALGWQTYMKNSPTLLSPHTPTFDASIISQYSPNQSVYDPDEISIDIRDMKSNNNGFGIPTGGDRYAYPDKNHPDMQLLMSQQHLHNASMGRSPSSLSEFPPPPPFSYHSDGYANKFSLNHVNQHQNVLEHSVNNNNININEYYWLYKQKQIELALLKQQHMYQQKNLYNNFRHNNNSPSPTPSSSSSTLSLYVSPTGAPKSPPLSPPPSTPIPPPISTSEHFNDGMPSPTSPPNSSKLPPYPIERRPSSSSNNNEKAPPRPIASPPPYRGHLQTRPYVEAYTYNFDD